MEVGGLEQVERGLLQRALRAAPASTRGRGGYPRRSVLASAASIQQAQGVREDVEDRPELLDAALRRARRVAHDRLADDAGDAAGQPAERADEAHRLGQAGRLALDDRRVPSGVWSRGAKPVPPVVTTRPANPSVISRQHPGDGIGAVGDDAGVDDVVAGGGELIDERRRWRRRGCRRPRRR